MFRVNVSSVSSKQFVVWDFFFFCAGTYFTFLLPRSGSQFFYKDMHSSILEIVPVISGHPLAFLS